MVKFPLFSLLHTAQTRDGAEGRFAKMKISPRMLDIKSVYPTMIYLTDNTFMVIKITKPFIHRKPFRHFRQRSHLERSTNTSSLKVRLHDTIRQEYTRLRCRFESSSPWRVMKSEKCKSACKIELSHRNAPKNRVNKH